MAHLLIIFAKIIRMGMPKVMPKVTQTLFSVYFISHTSHNLQTANNAPKNGVTAKKSNIYNFQWSIDTNQSFGFIRINQETFRKYQILHKLRIVHNPNINNKGDMHNLYCQFCFISNSPFPSMS